MTIHMFLCILHSIFITVDCGQKILKATHFSSFFQYFRYIMHAYLLSYQDTKDENKKSQQFKNSSVLSRVQLYETLWTVAHQASLSMGFSRQEYWSGLPCPPPGNFPDPRIEPRSPSLQADSLPLRHQVSPQNISNPRDFTREHSPLPLEWVAFPLSGDLPNPGLLHCFPDSSIGKESECNVGDLDSISGLGRSPEGKGYPLQYSGLENCMDSPSGCRVRLN